MYSKNNGVQYTVMYSILTNARLVVKHIGWTAVVELLKAGRVSLLTDQPATCNIVTYFVTSTTHLQGLIKYYIVLHTLDYGLVPLVQCFRHSSVINNRFG